MAYRRGLYWYRIRREGQRVRTEYLGLGELWARLDASEREKREIEREAVREEKRRELEVDRALDAEGALLRELTRVVLVANGYHQHKGQWRKRRNERSGGD